MCFQFVEKQNVQVRGRLGTIQVHWNYGDSMKCNIKNICYPFVEILHFMCNNV